MSGIINSAGSRSGVIGTTELDYEEGTWTPRSDLGSLSANSHRWYIKIGGMVWISASVQFPSSSDGNPQFLHDLPFTNGPNGYAPGTVGFTSWTSGSISELCVITWQSSSLVYFYNNNSGLTAANLSTSRVDFTIAMNINT